MSISRRAIIHIGGTKREQISQRKLDTKENKLFHDTPDDNFYFTIDAGPENKTELIDEQIDSILKSNTPRPKDLRKVQQINIQISTEDQHKLIQNTLDKKQENEILKRVQQAKQTIKKNKIERRKRETMGFSQLLIDCEMDIEYYNNIQKIFTQFEKKFFIQTNNPKHEFNPFKFSLNTKYTTPLDYAYDDTGIEVTRKKWNELNDTNTEYPLQEEFNQIMVDAQRNLIKVHHTNKHFSFGQNPFNSEYFYYFIQLSLFISYFYYEHDKEYTKKTSNHLNNSSSKNEQFYNNYIIEQFKKNAEINEDAFQNYVSQHTKDAQERTNIMYGQEDLHGLLGILLATSSPDDKKYNIIDAVAFYTYIYKKQGIRSFYNTIFFSLDKKDTYKQTLKIMSIFDLVDPDLFSELFNNIDKQAKGEGNDQFWYKRLGETYIKNTTTFDNKKNSPWLTSEKLKYDIFHDSSKKTLAEVIEHIKKKPKDTLNKPHEALIESYDKTPDNITKIITITNNEPFVSPKHYFSNGDTKLEMMRSFIKPLLMEIWSYAIGSLHTKNGNDHFHALNSYYKYLYKYGITGWILYMAIHLKNMRTSIHLSNDTKEIYNFQKVVDKIKDGTAVEGIIGHFFIPTEQDPFGSPNIAKGNQNLDYLYSSMFADPASPFLMKGIKMGHEFNFQYNVFLNPLTTNIKETYDKHFDFCIDHLKNIHGSIKTFETEFDKLYNRSLILYKNAYITENRLSKIKKTHKGITIVDKITDIWDKHKNDNRIHFKKNKEHHGEQLKGMDKGWLGDVKNDLLRNALDGVYHVCYNTFMKDVSKIMKPFVSPSKGKGKCPNIHALWPRNSGRPFIFVNKLHGDGGHHNSKLKRTSFFDEKNIKKKLLTGIISAGCLPNYWFNTKNMFTEEDIAKNKLLIEFGNNPSPNGIGGLMEWTEVENNLVSHLSSIPMHPTRADSTSSDDSDDSIEEKSREAPTVERKDSNEPIISDQEEPVVLGPTVEIVADRLAEQLDDEKINSEKITKLDYALDDVINIQRNQDRYDLPQKNDTAEGEYLPQKNDSGDDEEHTIPAKESQLPKAEKLTRKTIIKITLSRNYKAEIVPVPDGGDCLFEALSNFLKDKTEQISHQALRQKIVTHIMTGWVNYVDDILIEVDGRKRYKTPADYEKQMRATVADPDHPQGRFGGQAEIKAFMDMFPQYRIQILKYENSTMMELLDFRLIDIANPKVITLFLSDVHYQNIKKISNTESAGSVEQPNPSQVSQSTPSRNPETPQEKKLKHDINESEKKITRLRDRKKNHEVKALNYRDTGRTEMAINTMKRITLIEKAIGVQEHIINNRKAQIKNLQQGGSNNVYINKCKNHRHKKTRKFRLKLKDIDNWTHVYKPNNKKYTRRNN